MPRNVSSFEIKMTRYLYLTILLILLNVSLDIPIVRVAEAASVGGAKTSIQAQIPGRTDIRIYGYTAPNAIVQAASIRVFAQVSSDKTGYFIIDPLSISTQASEICLTTLDASQRQGFPLCVSLPPTNKPGEIGPLLLSPTISLSNGTIVQNQNSQANAAGQTLPNADVEISFFDIDSSRPTLTTGKPCRDCRVVPLLAGLLAMTTQFRISQVQAKDIPKLMTKTDQNGNYSINLPAGKAAAYRIFTKSFYGKVPTPKSQTLAFTITSYAQYWVKNILPKLIFFLMLLTLAVYLAWYEKKMGRINAWILSFNETKLRPFAVRKRLLLRRIWYNLREHLRQYQK